MKTDLTWVRSGYSGTQGGNCVEVAALPRSVAVRDSKNPDGPWLAFAAGEDISLTGEDISLSGGISP